MSDPSGTIPAVAGPAETNTDLPSAPFPRFQRIQSTDLVGTSAANRQHATSERRTETLRATMNQIIDVMNQLDVWFLRRNGSPQKDSVAGATADIPMNGRSLAALRAAIANGEPVRFEEFMALAATVNATSSTPRGMVAAFSIPCPAGWVPCDGTLYTSTGYIGDSGILTSYSGTPNWADLALLRTDLLTTWGGDGINSFRVPDYRGRAILGAGTGKNGQVVKIAVTGNGTGYSSPPTVTIGAPTSGVQATAIAVVENNKVVAIRITNPGSGYNSAPAVTITGIGTGASATASITLTSRLLGSYGGEETHVQTVNELAYHGHPTGNNTRVQLGLDNGTSYGVKTSNTSTPNDAMGGGEAFNIMQPWATANICIKY